MIENCPECKSELAYDVKYWVHCTKCEWSIMIDPEAIAGIPIPIKEEFYE